MKGAFDSESISKQGGASTFLSQYIGHKFNVGFDKLLTDYRHELLDAEPTVKEQLWAKVGKPGLHALAGSYSWGRPMAQRWIQEISRNSPTVAGLVAAAEAVLSRTLAFYSTPSVKTLRLKRGQWCFIESETHYRRRLVKKVSDPDKKPEPEVAKAVSLGFYIDAAYKEAHAAVVFNFDVGRAQTVDVKQLQEAGRAVSAQLDNSEKLSAIRELYFYKRFGTDLEDIAGNKTDPFYPGKAVLFEDKRYIVINRKGKNALIEDPGLGNTRLVPLKSLTAATSRTTIGKVDSMFNAASQGHLFAGQWVYTGARDWVKVDYDNCRARGGLPDLRRREALRFLHAGREKGGGPDRGHHGSDHKAAGEPAAIRGF